MKKFFILCIIVLNSVVLFGQFGPKDFPHDTSYYETFPRTVTARIYLSQKYVNFSVPTSSHTVEDVEYKANTKLNLGAGITIHNFSANVFYGFGFLNKDDAKGKTKGLDIQLHLYPRKWAVDVLGVFPKGYYLFPKGYAAPPNAQYYYRPDIKLSLVGVSAYRVPNKHKFSYRAAITQNEWQKKSAGSVLFGGEAYQGSIKGDSAFVPKSVETYFRQAGVRRLNFFTVGPSFGYAYTIVMHQHYFIMGSFVANADINLTKEETATTTRNKVSISPAGVYKAAIGYNGREWSVSANVTGNALFMKGASSPKNYFLPTGAYRISIARKISERKK